MEDDIQNKWKTTLKKRKKEDDLKRMEDNLKKWKVTSKKNGRLPQKKWKMT